MSESSAAVQEEMQTCVDCWVVVYVPAISIAVRPIKFWNFLADCSRKKLTYAGNGTRCGNFLVPFDSSCFKPSLTSLEQSVNQTETKCLSLKSCLAVKLSAVTCRGKAVQ